MTRRCTRTLVRERVIRAACKASASGCYNLLHCQIAGSPLSSRYRSGAERRRQHQGNDLGYGNNAARLGDLQPTPTGSGLRTQFND
jgi:hypothetical protein